MENYTLLLGFLATKTFLYMLLFATIGVSISLLFDSQKRDQSSLKTPSKFSLKFLLVDNWKSILLTFLVVIITLRFASSLFPAQFTTEAAGTPEGMEKWLFGSLGIGLGYNQLIQVLKQRANWLKVKR